jgi:cephalosporin-C deacetylase-like acetyl esterase
LLLLVLGTTFIGNARGVDADPALQVLPEGRSPVLHEYLLEEVSRQYDDRRDALHEALKSADAMRARREKLQLQLTKMVGELPQRTPLNARTLGTIECDGYRIEKVIFESRPHHHVTANLYLPDPLPGKVPGVLVPCGHSANGKASEAYQSVCVLLALQGCAALIYDPIGQGERHQILELSPHGTTEHTLVGPAALLAGINTANYRIWDGLRSMDYLASRDEVDPQRLGCTGNSGGGTMTTWLMAVDDRIAVAAPSCFITTVQRLFNTIGPQDCEQHFPGQGAWGIEHTDFITMRSPKPTLILAAERDFFDIGGTRTAYAEAEAVYRVLGQPERVGLFTCDDEHGFSQPRRQAAVAWLRRWLADDERTVVEPTLELQADADLQVTKTGQVMQEFDDEQSVVEFANRRAADLAASRKHSWQSQDRAQRQATIRRLLGLHGTPAAPQWTSNIATIARKGYTIEKLLIQSPDGVPLPALRFVPQITADEKQVFPAILHAHGKGKSIDAQSGGPIEKLVLLGNVVLAVDLRGCGETADDAQHAKYRNDEFRNAMLAMHVGRPLPGQRVDDLLTALEVLLHDTRVDADAIHLVGIERAGPVALHAAVLEPRFKSVRIENSIHSWQDDVVAKPLVANQLSHVVPGALEHYDLPDLAEMLGERAVNPSADAGGGR